MKKTTKLLYMRETNPTEPAITGGCCTRGSKEIVDIEIAMYRSAGIIIITGTITIAPETIAITTIELLLKLT
jgi:hypothetical protein